MASVIVGRAKCPECGFESAHVKKSDKCLYRYCPACGINGPHARTEAQRENMMKGMRPVQAAPAATPAPTPSPTDKNAAAAPPTQPSPTPSGTATPPPTPPTPPKRRGLFGGLGA